MATNLIFRITPDQTLFPEYPSFALFVKKRTFGWPWTGDDYDWWCLPGYFRENLGPASTSDLTQVGGKGYEFYVSSGKKAAANSLYGVLHSVPKSFSIGATGPASITYGGARVKQFLTDGRSEANLYSDWKLVNVY